MDIQILVKLVNEGGSSYKIAKQLSCSQTNIRYWLKKYNLKTRRTLGEIDNSKYCPRCKVILPRLEFHNRRNGEGNSTYCKKCTTNQTLERQNKFKMMAIEYLGGKCSICGYFKCSGALDFHHNGQGKDFNISKARGYTFEKARPELDKCILVCANCHREIHTSHCSS